MYADGTGMRENKKGRLQMDDNKLAKIVDQAASNILALPKNGEFESRVGGIVDQAVEEAGGDSVALFAVTEALTKKVPIGARILRSLRNAYRQDRILDEAKLSLVYLLAGDPDADAIEIGKQVDQALGLCGVACVASEALAKLAAKLEVTPRKLAKYRDVFLVAQLGGTELAKLTPNFPSSVLLQFSRILKADGLMPWAKKDIIITVAGGVAKNALVGKQVATLVSHILVAGKTEALPIVPSWNFPPALARGTENQEVATDENAA